VESVGRHTKEGSMLRVLPRARGGSGVLPGCSLMLHLDPDAESFYRFTQVLSNVAAGRSYHSENVHPSRFRVELLVRTTWTARGCSEASASFFYREPLEQATIEFSLWAAAPTSELAFYWSNGLQQAASFAR